MGNNGLKIAVLVGSLALAAASFPAFAAAEADSLEQAVHRGKVLFMTATFGGSGRHCTTCHKEGGTAMSELPDGRKFPSLSNAAAIFPRYDAETHRVKTLPDQVQACVRNALQGTAPAFESPEMTELVSYITSLSEGKPIEMDGKPR